MMEEGTPGKRDVLNPSKIKSASVKSERLKRKTMSQKLRVVFVSFSHLARVGSLVGDDESLEGWVVTDIP